MTSDARRPDTRSSGRLTCARPGRRADGTADRAGRREAASTLWGALSFAGSPGGVPITEARRLGLVVATHSIAPPSYPPAHEAYAAGISSTIVIRSLQGWQPPSGEGILRPFGRRRDPRGRMRTWSGASARSDAKCLDHVIVMNAAGLHRVLLDYVTYYAFTNTLGARQGHAVPASGHTAVNRSHRCHSGSRRSPSPFRPHRRVAVVQRQSQRQLTVPPGRTCLRCSE